MKNILLFSVLMSLMVPTLAYADTSYSDIREPQDMSYEDLSARSEENQKIWNQTIQSYELNYNDSYRKYWDLYTEAYQRNKRIQK